MNACVIAETPEGAKSLCAWAREQSYAVTLIAPGVTPVEGIADKVFAIEVPADRPIDEAWATVASLVDREKPEVALVEPTRSLKVIGGRLAAHLGEAAIGEVVEFDGADALTMYYGGVAQRRSKSRGACAVYFVRAGVAGESESSGTDEIETVAFIEPPCSVEMVSSLPREKSDVNLGAADVVVAGGRGFSEKGELDLLRAFAEAVGGEVGCTRPLAEGVDWMPKESYIGVSGLMLTPKVYVGVGVSGQMQHMVGVNRANTVFAINKDKNAPIFKQCDWGLVGDLKTVLPALTEEL